MAFEVNKGKDFIYMIPVIFLIVFLYLMMYRDGRLDEKLPEKLKSENLIKKKEKDQLDEKKLENNEAMVLNAFNKNNKKMNNLEIGKKYKTESGLEYEVLSLGGGSRPVATDTVEVHYEGTLKDGTIFDSSYKRGEKISFPLNQVIAGWTEGLQLMPVGSKFRFTIPANLAYGERALPGIPANSTLIFIVELFDIK